MLSKNLNKLQIRAEILNSIKNLSSTQQKSDEFIASILIPLDKIEDKATILDVLIKEIIASNDNNRFLTIVFLLETLIPKEMLEKQLWQVLEQPKIDDAIKSNIINILRDLGNQINYDKYVEYFENPDSIIDADTEKLLESAVLNPEAQIDFLDFIEALPDKDRTILIDSLSSDYKGDELTNIFIPLIYANPDNELCKYAVERLGESKSELAIDPLLWAIESTQNEEVKAAVKKSLNLLKLSGIKESKANKFYKNILSNSIVQDAYISLPDGRGSVGVLISRKRIEDNSIQMFATVFNETNGIVDCFGFNSIKKEEFDRIVNKFYTNQEKITAPISLIKTLLLKAEELSLQNYRKVSYEYVCWKNILYDVEPIEDAASYLTQNLEKIKITLEDLKSLFATTIFDNWFFETSDNEFFDRLLNKAIACLTKEEKMDRILDEVESYMMLDYAKIWSEKDIERIKQRLTLTAYLLEKQGHKKHADLIYSINFNNDIKTEFLMNIIKSSLYQFLLREKEKYQNSIISTNIFSKRNEANNLLIKKEVLDFITKQVENRWSL